VNLRIGTRGSQLALWQANEVARRLAGVGLATEIVVIRTSGDQLSEALLADAGGKRLFVKEIEDALIDRRVDVAVHSTKDMPVDDPPGLTVAAWLPREEPWDALVLPARLGAVAATLEAVVEAMGASPAIGTGSIRRITQLQRLLPHARFQPIRGNLDTRLRKLDEGGYDAIVLACAGLKRLGAAARITFPLPLTAAVPAPGQGAVAVQVRTDTPPEVLARIASIDDRATRAAVTAERVVVTRLGGGCQAPIGALALPGAGGALDLHAAVTAFDGDELRAMAAGRLDAPESLGRQVAERLIADGARELLARSAVERQDEDHGPSGG
jgi:hydroxymethylbilane synthase